ncbi:MAG: hypothetical protein WCN27_05335 [Alphaproteobacteria bacterium]
MVGCNLKLVTEIIKDLIVEEFVTKLGLKVSLSQIPSPHINP